jgi:hypothetical protein
MVIDRWSVASVEADLQMGLTLAVAAREGEELK